MCEIVNNVYAEEDLYTAFEGIQERLYIYNEDQEYKYYRVIILEITEEEYLKEENTL